MNRRAFTISVLAMTACGALMWVRWKPGSTLLSHAGAGGQTSQITELMGARASEAESGESRDSSARAKDLSRDDRRKIRIVDEVLNRKNDNDPRLDGELKSLGPQVKQALKRKYAALPREGFNERGTLVFLLGRNVSSAADVAFLHEVLAEPPCRGLADCSGADVAPHSTVAAGHEGGDEVTLAYPQLVALKALESVIAGSLSSAALREAALREVELARRSPTARVAALSEKIIAKNRSQRRGRQ